MARPIQERRDCRDCCQHPAPDKGQSRKFNAAGREFVLGAGSPPAERSNGPTKYIPEICRLLRRGAGLSRGPCRMRSHSARRSGEDTARIRRLEGWIPPTGAASPQGSESTIARWLNLYNRKRRAQWRAWRRSLPHPRKSSRIKTCRNLAAGLVCHGPPAARQILPGAGTEGGWRLVRPWLTAAIYMRTRKWLAWVVVETPSSDSIAAVLKRLFLDYGLPQTLYWDNGKDFTCEWLEGRAAKLRKRIAWRICLGMEWRCRHLGVRVCHAIVRRARSRSLSRISAGSRNSSGTLP